VRRAVVASVLLHAIGGLVGWCGTDHAPGAGSKSLVDIELAPAAPVAERLPDEIARQLAQAANAVPSPDLPPEPDPTKPESGTGGIDAQIDAAVDVRPKRRADAEDQVAVSDAMMPDASMVAVADAGAGATMAAIGGDAGATALATGDAVTVAMIDPGAGTGSGSAGGPITGDTPTEAGVPGTGTDGAVSPGTASNLLAYFPPGHVVTALIRFDRIRGSRWQAPVELLFKPMPDHVTLIGDQSLGDLFDTVIISSPSPQDAIATTLAIRSHVSRSQVRTMLDQPETPVTWSAAKGGLYGARGVGTRVQRHDRRNFLWPYLDWLVLAQPRDVAGLGARASGDLDTVVARVKLPPWLAQLPTIEAETGTKPDGPALVLTLAPTSKRYDLPDVGLDLASVPSPERLTVSLEFVKQGFIVRGNLKFRSEADAIEFVDSANRTRDRVLDSTILRGILNRARAFNAVNGLTLDRREARVSYATSVSVADADAILAIAAQYLKVWFAEAAERQDQKDRRDGAGPK
jgi:hypothetical protein